jgi:TPP-dependent pyruvate/acetoin dehydrogenase alpha subunit
VPDAAHGGPRRPRRRLLRPEGLFEEWAKRDPIERFRTGCARTPTSDDEEDEIASDVKKLLNDALSARRSRRCPTGDAAEGVYATPEDLDTPHHK